MIRQPHLVAGEPEHALERAPQDRVVVDDENPLRHRALLAQVLGTCQGEEVAAFISSSL